MDRQMQALIQAVSTGAGRMSNLFFLTDTDMEQKADITPVSQKKDIGNGKLMVEILRQGFPYATILCEDLETLPGSSEIVIRVDPWDGSSFSFARVALPCVGITVSRKGEDIAAAVAMPFGDGPDDKVIITAEKGAGAFQYSLPHYWKTNSIGDPKRLQVQDRPKEESVAGRIVLENEQTVDPRRKLIKALFPLVTYWESARSSIGTAMMVAQGRYVLALEDCVGGHHDIGPGSVIVTEAGGKVFTPDGLTPTAGQYHCCLITNGQHYRALREAFAKAYGGYTGFRPPSN